MATSKEFMKKSDWNADWIWLDYISPAIIHEEFRGLKEIGILDVEKNRWGLFRRTFTLPENHENKTSTRAPLKISVDGRYKLYVNGRYVGRGIYRCNKFNWYYDEYDVSELLKPGLNVIAVLAQFFGKDLAWYEMMFPGGLARSEGCKGQLIFELDLVDNETHSVLDVLAKSDQDTRGFILNAYEHTLKQVWLGLPFLEIFDSKLMPKGWNAVDFDDSVSTWDHTKVLNIGNTWSQLIPCDIPHLDEIPFTAKRIINAGNVEPFFDAEDIEDSHMPGEEPIDFFLQHAFSPIDGSKTDEFSEKFSYGNLTFVISEEQTIGIVLDLEKVRSGFLFFQFETPSDDVIVDVGWSERLDSSKEVPVPHYSPYEMKYGMQYKSAAGLNHYEMFHWYGYRYVHLNFRLNQNTQLSDTVQIKINGVGINQFLYPARHVGYFKCNDEKINVLVEACAWTLRNCMHDGYEDCPSREQRQWIGDAYPEIMINYALFGDTALARKLINQTAQSQRGDGLTFMATPGDHDIHGVTIPDYCLYWIMIVYEYYQYTGDSSVILENFPVILRAVKWFISYIDENTGLITDIPYWIFIDWSENDKWGANGVLNAQFYHVLQIIIEMSQIVGWDGSVEDLKPLVEPIAHGINKYLWNNDRGAYIDSVEVSQTEQSVHIKQSKKVSYHTNAVVMLYDIAPAERIPSIITNVFERNYSDCYIKSRQPLWKDRTAPKLNEEEHVIIAEPFFMHNVCQALAKIGRTDIIMRFIKDGWLKMIEHGGTTIWESWSDVGSHCHAWAATPGYDLIRHCAGIKYIEPGCVKVEISPNLMALEWVDAGCPTPHGIIKVKWKWIEEKYKFILMYKGPQEIDYVIKHPVIPNMSLKDIKRSQSQGFQILDCLYEPS